MCSYVLGSRVVLASVVTAKPYTYKLPTAWSRHGSRIHASTSNPIRNLLVRTRVHTVFF